MRERQPETLDVCLLHREAALDRETLRARANDRIGEARADREARRDEIERFQASARLAPRLGGDEARRHAVGSDRPAIAQLRRRFLEHVGRGGIVRRKLIAGAHQSVRLDVAAQGPHVLEARAAIVDGKTAGRSRLDDGDDELRGARRVRRRTQNARRRDARNVVRKQQRALQCRKRERPHVHHRLDIGAHQRLRRGVATLDRHRGDITLDHVDLEDAVVDALRRYEGVRQHESFAPVHVLDRVGDVENVRDRHFLAEQILVERTKFLRRQSLRALDLNVGEREAQFLDRARNLRARRRLDREVEGRLRRLRGRRPVAARFDGAGKLATRERHDLAIGQPVHSPREPRAQQTDADQRPSLRWQQCAFPQRKFSPPPTRTITRKRLARRARDPTFG